MEPISFNTFNHKIQTYFVFTTLEIRMNIPTIDLRTFIIQIAQGALVGLGEIEDPETKQTTVNLPFALHNIGVIQMLANKTQANQTAEEAELIKALLKELEEKASEHTKTQ